MTDAKILNSTLDRLIESSPAPVLTREFAPKMAGTLRSDLHRVKPLSSVAASAAGIAAAFLALAAILITVLRPMAFGAGVFQVTVVGLDLAAGMGALSIMLARELRPGSPRPFSGLTFSAVFAAGFFAAVGILFPWRGAESFVRDGFPCLRSGMLMAIPAALLFGILAKSGIVLAPRTFGAILGALAGLFGATVLEFHCPYQNAAHLLVWHGSIVAAGSLLGLLIALIVDRNRISRPVEVRRVK